MEYMGSLYRPSTAEPDVHSAAVDKSDSLTRLGGGTGPLLYTSAVPAARMQIITRPLSAVPIDTNIKLSSRERSRLSLTLLLTALFLVFLGFMLYISDSPPDLGVTVGANAEGRRVVTWVVPYGIAYEQGVRTGDVV